MKNEIDKLKTITIEKATKSYILNKKKIDKYIKIDIIKRLWTQFENLQEHVLCWIFMIKQTYV
jgi:hypothetical protein